jgi:hypothetical protein
MPERPLDPSNDEDYLNILLHDVDFALIKERQGDGTPAAASETDMLIGKTDGIELHKPLVIKGDIGATTTDIEQIDINDKIGEIRLQTSNSVYRLDRINPEKKSREMSLRFLRRGYLDFDDKMPDGFFDGGRHTTFVIKDGILIPKSPREIILLHSGIDDALKKITNDAENLLSGVSDMKTKIKMLAMYVSNLMGGSQAYKNPQTDIEILSDMDIANLQRKPNSGILQIGYLTHGVCRHRALLFKYLADRLGIPSRLIKGDYASPHQWNVVIVEGKYYVVDVMHDPTQLYEEDSKKAQIYTRKGVKKGFRGGFGGRSVFKPN